MSRITVWDAARGFAALLGRLITKRGKPVALVSPYRPPTSPERQAAIDHAVALMRKGLPWGDRGPPFTRDEMHER